MNECVDEFNPPDPNYTGPIRNSHGNKAWFKNGLLHRDEGPAMILYTYRGGVADEGWFQNGKYHREDGPAWISYYDDFECSRYYYLNDKEYTRKEFERMQKLNHFFKDNE